MTETAANRPADADVQKMVDRIAVIVAIPGRRNRFRRCADCAGIGRRRTISQTSTRSLRDSFPLDTQRAGAAAAGGRILDCDPLVDLGVGVHVRARCV